MKLIRETYKEATILLKNTALGYFGGADIDGIFHVFNKIGLQKYSNFVDLGSGDGRVVFVASKFTNAAGFEIDNELYEKSVEIKKRLRINNANFYNKNYLHENFSRYDVLFIYPDQHLHKVENKLLKEMKERAILIHYGSNFFPLQLKRAGYDFNGIMAGIYRKE